MKKLLATILAFSCAFGAWAEAVSHFSGTDFSTYPVGAFSTETDDSGVAETDQRYWFTGSKEDFDGDVVNVSSNVETGVTENYLEFESSITNPVYRTVNNSFGAKAPDATTGENANQGFLAKKIGNGLFIDTEVQFTPYLVNENHPAPEPLTNKDKIIVWVKEEESENEGEANKTNLIVTAGCIGGNGMASVKHYKVFYDADADGIDDTDKLCQGQHRLTIKAFEDVSANPLLTIAGFVVYIDEKLVEYYNPNENAFDGIDESKLLLEATPAKYYKAEKKRLFPSLMGNTAGGVDGGDEISAVGFAGMGQVGEVWFDDYSTAYPAFASDDINFSIIVDPSVASYKYNGQTYYETQTFAVKPGTASIEVTDVMYAPGWVAKAGTWYAGTMQVMNVGSADGDSGTFSFENGSLFTLAGFKANFEVTVNGVTTAFQTLFGNTAEGGALAAAYGGTLKLMGDIEIAEGLIVIEEGKTLTIDLNGHTLLGTSETYATISNNGNLTIVDSSMEKTGRVWGSSSSGYWAINNNGTLNLKSGTFGYIDKGDYNIAINILGGKYLDQEVNYENPTYVPTTAKDFYLDVDTDVYQVEWSSMPVDGQNYWFATVLEKSVTVTLPAASENSSWKVLVGETEYQVVDNQVAVPVGSELALYLVAATGYEFANAAAEVVVAHNQGAVNSNADWSTTLGELPVPTLKVVDPWEPSEETDVSATNKVAEIFGKDSPAATNITTYADYTNLVEYIKTAGKTNPGSTPDSLTAEEKTYIIESLKLGAKALFTAEPKIKLTEAQPSTEDLAKAGDWKFDVEVTQGGDATALKVATEKVKALVKIRSDLKNGTWAAPQTGNIDAKEGTGNKISITIKFGNAKSGFMMIAE